VQVDLSDESAQASLSALATGLPSLIELHLLNMEPEPFHLHPALLARLTHLTHAPRRGAKPAGSLWYGLISDAVQAWSYLAATQQGSSSTPPPPKHLLPFMSLQELSLTGVSLPWHILTALSACSQLRHLAVHSLTKVDNPPAGYYGGAPDKLPPSLRCISVKYLYVAEVARMPGLAAVSD
jgi:hypothetical protein